MKFSQILITSLLTVSASTLFAAEDASKVSKPVKAEVTTTMIEEPASIPQTKNAEAQAVKEQTSETVILKPDTTKYKYEEENKKK